MFLILPHSAEVRIGRIPWIAVVILLFCILISLYQEHRREGHQLLINPYCASINDELRAPDELDFLRTDEYTCSDTLTFIHDLPDKSVLTELVRASFVGEKKTSGEKYTLFDTNEITRYLERHYQSIRDDLPPSLDATLVYDPRSFNPLRSLLSALSHGDWWHLIGNLIFFLAFAPVVELIINSTIRFMASLIAIAVATDMAYSLSVLLGAPPVPTLGLSGVVMGVIGMSAYLVPNVRIRTLVWIVFYLRNWRIPALFLAIWYIGWDAYYLFTEDYSSGVNFMAHVVGGVTGYLIARFWFSDRREEVREEVDDEVEYMRSRRQDQHGIMSSYRDKSTRFENYHRERDANRAFGAYLEAIHHAVNCGQSSEAIIRLLEKYDEYHLSLELYEEILEEMLKWRPSRATECLMRLLITEYIDSQKYARAIELVNKGYTLNDQFLLSEERELVLLKSIASKQGILLGHLSSSGAPA